MKKTSANSTFFNCEVHTEFPANYYCKTCKKLLCLKCSTEHMQKGCTVDSCELVGNVMMMELLKETENQSINLDISPLITSLITKMRDSFKWIEKETISGLQECQKKIGKNMISNEAKKKMKQLENEKNSTGLYMLCMNIKEQRNKDDAKEKQNNSTEIIKEYENKMQKILLEFNKRFTEIYSMINPKSIPKQLVPQIPDSQPKVNPLPREEVKVESILYLFDKVAIPLPLKNCTSNFDSCVILPVVNNAAEIKAELEKKHKCEIKELNDVINEKNRKVADLISILRLNILIEDEEFKVKPSPNKNKNDVVNLLV